MASSSPVFAGVPTPQLLDSPSASSGVVTVAGKALSFSILMVLAKEVVTVLVMSRIAPAEETTTLVITLAEAGAAVEAGAYRAGLMSVYSPVSPPDAEVVKTVSRVAPKVSRVIFHHLHPCSVASAAEVSVYLGPVRYSRHRRVRG